MSEPQEGDSAQPFPLSQDGGGEVAAAQDGARHWIRHVAAMAGRGAAWASPRAMLASLCASSLLPIALAEPGLPAAVAGLQVVGSVGANVLATLISDSLSAARTRTRSSTGPSAPDAVSGLAGQAAFEEQVRQELAARLEKVLEAQDEQADALAAVLATVLERIDAATGGSPRHVDTGCHAASSTLSMVCCS